MNSRKPGIFFALCSLLLLLVPGVSAQSTGSVVGAITVQGEGSASAPAETATVMISVGNSDGFAAEPIEPATIDTMIQPSIDPSVVVDAIVANGVPAENIEIANSQFNGEWGSNMPADPVMIMVSIDQPTVEGLAALLETVRDAAHEEDMLINQFSVIFGVADCRSLRQEARANAVENAKHEAEDQATALGIKIGDVLASSDSYPMSMGSFQANTCVSGAIAMPYDLRYSATPFDPNQPAAVTVVIAVQVSYALP